MENNNKMGKPVLIALVVILLTVVGITTYNSYKNSRTGDEQVVRTFTQTEIQAFVEQYLKTNIGSILTQNGIEISPDFSFVETMFFDDAQTATVTFFNNKKTYVATFNYSFNKENGEVVISNFSINELPEVKG